MKLTLNEIIEAQAENPELIFRLVTKPETDPKSLHIDQGSGIVARLADRDAGRRYANIYYEGNRYNAVNLQTLVDREKCAAGRLHTHYPTIARTSLPLEQAFELFDFEIPEVPLVPQIPEPKRHRYAHDARGWQPN